MRDPTDDGQQNQLYSNVSALIIMMVSTALILSVPIRFVFIATGIFIPTDMIVIESLVYLIAGFIGLGCGIILYKYVGWTFGEPRLKP